MTPPAINFIRPPWSTLWASRAMGACLTLAPNLESWSRSPLKPAIVFTIGLLKNRQPFVANCGAASFLLCSKHDPYLQHLDALVRKGGTSMSLPFIIPALIIATLGSGISAPPVGAQTTPAPSTTQPTPVRNILASAGLPSVVDVPLHYRLLRVNLPAGQSTSFKGANGFLFQMSGMLAVTTSGDSRTLRNSDAMFVGRGESATLKAAGTEPAVFLHFLLLPAADLERVVEEAPAVVT